MAIRRPMQPVQPAQLGRSFAGGSQNFNESTGMMNGGGGGGSVPMPNQRMTRQMGMPQQPAPMQQPQNRLSMLMHPQRGGTPPWGEWTPPIQQTAPPIQVGQPNYQRPVNPSWNGITTPAQPLYPMLTGRVQQPIQPWTGSGIAPSAPAEQNNPYQTPWIPKPWEITGW